MRIGKKMVAVTKTEYEVSGTAADDDDDTGTAGRETWQFHIGIAIKTWPPAVAIVLWACNCRGLDYRQRGQGMDRQSTTWKHRCRSENSDRQPRK